MPAREYDQRRTARLGIATRPPAASPRALLLGALLYTAFGALFPRLSYRMRRVARAGPREVALRVARMTLVNIGADAVMRWIARNAVRQEEIYERLRRELGRPPWPGEVFDAWAADWTAPLPNNPRTLR